MNYSSSYDAWLEAPYVDAAREQEAFEKWCEGEGVDYDDPTAWDRFEEWCQERAESAAEDAAEARQADRDAEPDWY